jgi:hypothetical protein
MFNLEITITLPASITDKVKISLDQLIDLDYLAIIDMDNKEAITKALNRYANDYLNVMFNNYVEVNMLAIECD